MVEHTTLVEQLKALGIPEGKPLMVHASLRRVGPIAVGRVGNCTAELLEAKTFVDFAVKWMEDNLYD
jgi:aminoglycoside N3'-acetyltransferase